MAVPSHSDTSDSLRNLTDNDRRVTEIGLLQHTPTNPGLGSPVDKSKKSVRWAENNSSSEKRSGSYSHRKKDERVITPDY